MKTAEEYLESLTRVGGNRLALVFPDGSLVDPLIGEPYASQYRQHVLNAIRAYAQECLEAEREG